LGTAHATAYAVHVLALNAGSSSLKFALFAVADPVAEVARGTLDRMGRGDATLTVTQAGGRRHTLSAGAGNGAASDAVLRWLDSNGLRAGLQMVGHRVVHGGLKFAAPTLIDDEVIRELRGLVALSPDHLPAEIELIERFRTRLPQARHVACFDTAFHRDLPHVAQLLPLPRRYYAKGVRRFGFHGLSYAYLVEQLGSRGRLVLAHLGNGSSLAAVREGKCLDTTMAFTPAAGVPMSTRTGDLDPGIGPYLARTENLGSAEFQHLVNHESGLLGVSETSSDMRDLLSREADDVRAAEAVAMYCYQIAKTIGAFAVVLGGLDALVFTGGIGEHAAPVRSRICERLAFLGVTLDARANEANAKVISTDASAVSVRVVATDEQLMIARETARLLQEA
jgi:acetate kinase